MNLNLVKLFAAKAKRPASISPAAMLAVASKTKHRQHSANHWQQLGLFLKQRQRASTEMVQLDQALMPQLQKLGLKHHDE